MPKFKKKGQHARLEELHPDHFSFKTTAYHGFPSSPSALSFEPENQFLAIGTRTGELRIYGRPGVEFHAQLDNEAEILEIFSLRGLHQFITVSADNRLILWQLGEGEDTPCTLTASKEYKLDPDGGKTITKCCLSQVNGNFYVGTEGGNVFILDLMNFTLSTEVIYWNNATAPLSQSQSAANPGRVKCMEVCPADPNFLLIGYDKGVVSLWSVNRGLPTKNFPASIQDCQQPLESLSWQNDGVKFVSSHSDSSIYFWAISSSSPNEGPTKHYDTGDGDCTPITKIKWMNTDQNPLIVFAGGIPTEQEDEHHTVTVIQGADHIALDFTSKVIDFVTITDPSTRRGKAIIVLCEHELLAFDLEAPKCPQIRKPYLYTLHASPVRCVQLYENCSLDLFVALHELSITSPPAHEHYSHMEWPAMGGCVRAAEANLYDILLTGHENGMVRFWDVTTGAMRLIYELKTANLFLGEDIDPALLDDFADFSWPPYRKVSSYDPFEDDSRLSIRFINFCPFSRTLCVGGAGGQAITFTFNPVPSEVKLRSEKAEIFLGNQPRDRRAGLRKEQPLECKTEPIHLPAGFQVTFCLQCIPATPITALAFRPDWGLLAAGISKGFVVANFLVKSLVMIHPTVSPDGLGARSINRVQSFRRSIRDSFRRRRSASTSTSADDRKKIAEALNTEAGIKGQGGQKQRGHRPRASSEPNSPVDTRSPPPDAAASSQVPPELAGYVTHLAFYETHLTSSNTCTPCVLASTKGSSIIRYTLTLPPPRDRNEAINRAFIAGKDYSLLHAAPIVAIFVLDHDGVPIPDPHEVKAHLVPEPDNRSPHLAVICTQEQIKMVALPGFKQKRKEKVLDSMHEKILKAWVIRVKVAASPVGAPRDWNPALVLLTSVGNLLTYSLPDLRPIYEQDQVISPSDQKAIQSLTISPFGEVLHLRSFTELERSLLCSYAIPFHITMLPNLFPFEGSTPPVKPGGRRISEQVGGAQQVVTVDVEASDRRSGSRSATRSVTRSPEREGEGALVNGTSEISVEKRQDPEGASNVGPVSATNGHAPTTNGMLSGRTSRSSGSDRPPSTIDKEVANAKAFIESVKKRSVSTSSSSSSSSSDESSDDDEIPSPPAAGNDDMTFGNLFAQTTFEELGDGSKELDNIIASSLQQLESARAFYEQMQARVKKSD